MGAGGFFEGSEMKKEIECVFVSMGDKYPADAEYIDTQAAKPIYIANDIGQKYLESTGDYDSFPMLIQLYKKGKYKGTFRINLCAVAERCKTIKSDLDPQTETGAF